jgi:symplekin
VQARYNTILQSQPTQPSSPQSVPLVIAPTAPQSPTVGTTTSTELVATKILPPLKKDLEEDVEDEEEIQLQLGEFQLPPPSPLTHLHLQHVSIGAIDRMFVMIDEFEKTSLIARKTKLGVNRLAASNWDREGWIALLIRMATRGSQDDLSIKSEEGRPLGWPTTYENGCIIMLSGILGREWILL